MYGSSLSLCSTELALMELNILQRPPNVLRKLAGLEVCPVLLVAASGENMSTVAEGYGRVTKDEMGDGDGDTSTLAQVPKCCHGSALGKHAGTSSGLPSHHAHPPCVGQPSRVRNGFNICEFEQQGDTGNERVRIGRQTHRSSWLILCARDCLRWYGSVRYNE